MMNMNVLKTALESFGILLVQETCKKYTEVAPEQWNRIYLSLAESMLVPTLEAIVIQNMQEAAPVNQDADQLNQRLSIEKFYQQLFINILNNCRQEMKHRNFTVTPQWLMAFIAFQHGFFAAITLAIEITLDNISNSSNNNNNNQTKRQHPINQTGLLNGRKQSKRSLSNRLQIMLTLEQLRACKLSWPQWASELDWHSLPTPELVDGIKMLLADQDNLYKTTAGAAQEINNNQTVLVCLLAVLKTRRDITDQQYAEILLCGRKIEFHVNEASDALTESCRDENKKQVFSLLMMELNQCYRFHEMNPIFTYRIVLAHLQDIDYWHASERNVIYRCYCLLDSDAKAQLLLDFIACCADSESTVSLVDSTSVSSSICAPDAFHASSTSSSSNSCHEQQENLVHPFASRNWQYHYALSIQEQMVVMRLFSIISRDIFSATANNSDLSPEMMVRLLDRLCRITLVGTIDIVATGGMDIIINYLSTWLRSRYNKHEDHRDLCFLLKNTSSDLAARSLCRIANSYPLIEFSEECVTLFLTQPMFTKILLANRQDLSHLLAALGDALLSYSDDTLVAIFQNMPRAAGAYYLEGQLLRGKVGQSTTLQKICLQRNFNQSYSLTIASSAPWKLDELIHLCTDVSQLSAQIRLILIKDINRIIAKNSKEFDSASFHLCVMQALRHAQPTSKQANREFFADLVLFLVPFMRFFTIAQCHQIVREIPESEIIAVMEERYHRSDDFLQLLDIDAQQLQSIPLGLSKFIIVLAQNPFFAARIVENLALSTIVRIFVSYEDFPDELIQPLLMPYLHKYAQPASLVHTQLELTILIKRFAHSRNFLKLIFTESKFLPYISISALQAVLTTPDLPLNSTEEIQAANQLFKRTVVCQVNVLNQYSVEELMSLFNSRGLTDSIQRKTILMVVAGKTITSKADVVAGLNYIFTRVTSGTIPLAVAALVDFFLRQLEGQELWQRWSFLKTEDEITNGLTLADCIAPLKLRLNREVALTLLSSDYLSERAYEFVLNEVVASQYYFNFDFLINLSQFEGFHTLHHCRVMFATFARLNPAFHPILPFLDALNATSPQDSARLKAIEKARLVSIVYHILGAAQKNNKVKKILLPHLSSPGQTGILSKEHFLTLAKQIHSDDPLSNNEYQYWISQYPAMDHQLVEILYPDQFAFEDVLFLLRMRHPLSEENKHFFLNKAVALARMGNVRQIIHFLYHFTFKQKEYLSALNEDVKRIERTLSWPEHSDAINIKMILQKYSAQSARAKNQLTQLEVSFLLEEFLLYISQQNKSSIVCLTDNRWQYLQVRCGNFNEYLTLPLEPCRIGQHVFINHGEFLGLQNLSRALAVIKARAQAKQGYLFEENTFMYLDPVLQFRTPYTLTVSDREYLSSQTKVQPEATQRSKSTTANRAVSSTSSASSTSPSASANQLIRQKF